MLLADSQKMILVFIFKRKDIFRPLNTYTKWKIGNLLEKNSLISNRDRFLKSEFFKTMVLKNIFIAQSNTYKYDREKLLDFARECMEDEKNNDVAKSFKNTFERIPALPPNWE